jgi:hypothetical protein
VLQTAHFLQILQPNLCINFSSPPCVPHVSSIGPVLIQINPLITLLSNSSRSVLTLPSHLRSSFPTIAYFQVLQQNCRCASVLFRMKINLIAVLCLDLRSGSFFSPSSCRNKSPLRHLCSFYLLFYTCVITVTLQ